MLATFRRVQTQKVNNAQEVTFTYDTDDLLTGVTGAGVSFTLVRHPQHGLLTGTTLGTVTDTYQYNGFGEVSQYEARVGTSPVFTVQYQERDKLGRLQKKTETLGGSTTVYDYVYDKAGRLKDVKQNGVVTATYTYDSNGNRLTAPGLSSPPEYDAQDRLKSYGAATYAYTPNGELLTKTVGGQTTTYHYDVLGNLRQVILFDGDQLEYIVDGQNRRIGKKVNGALVQGFLYHDQLEPVAELNGNGAVVTRFVYGSKSHVPDFMVTYNPSTNTSTGTYRIIGDHLGSPRLVVNTADGTIAQRMDYDEFGNVINDTSPGFQPFGFAGGLYDQHTKLARFGAREYDAETGRWTAKDPIKFKRRSANLYGYVLDDPINRRDSNGKTFLSDLTVGQVVKGTLSVYSIYEFLRTAHSFFQVDQRAEAAKAARQRYEEECLIKLSEGKPNACAEAHQEYRDAGGKLARQNGNLIIDVEGHLYDMYGDLADIAPR